MKKIITMVFTIMILSLNGLILKADCESDKSDTFIYYETAPIYEDGKVDIYMDMYGVRKGVRVEVYNDFENTTHTYTHDDADDVDNTLEIIVENVDRDINFKVDVYTDSCGDTPIATYGSEVKKVNTYAFSDFCLMNHYKSELCQADANTEGMTEEEVKKKVERDIKNYDFKVNIKTSVKRYYLFVLIPMLIIIIFFIIRIIILKRKKNKQLN